VNRYPPFERLVSLYAVQPLRRLLGVQGDNMLSVLMYHSISDADESAVAPYYRLCTPPALFERHLQIIREKGYGILGLAEAVEQLHNGTLTGGNVVITFDDGLLDTYENAFPLLLRHGAPATVFLPVNFITDRTMRLRGQEHLTWQNVIEMAQNGMAFGSHTLTHRNLRILPRAVLANEIARSKVIIEDHLGITVQSFSYPFAFPETEKRLILFIRQCLEHNKYTCGVTTMIGTASASQDRFFLHRIPVNSSDDEALFTAKLTGSYDWLHGVQYAFKKVRRMVDV